MGAVSATWRRGSEGQAYAGQPLCNRCGVWYSRHPDSPPGAFAAEVNTLPYAILAAACCFPWHSAGWNEGLYTRSLYPIHLMHLQHEFVL